jgi:hypothetical protein
MQRPDYGFFLTKQVTGTKGAAGLERLIFMTVPTDLSNIFFM